ncbi:hypothetical protein G6F40_015317 [Rhizopus arrhizus]|nr:hypothetical protein G6F40_015317 [Rhizopus arrhizus]
MRQDGKHQTKRRARQEARFGHPALCDLLNLARVDPILGPCVIRGGVSDLRPAIGPQVVESAADAFPQVAYAK